MASRSAIAGAVKQLEAYGLAQRTRRAGERVDRVSPSLDALEPRNFDSGLFESQAALLREGMALLKDAPPRRRAALEELVALAESLASACLRCCGSGGSMDAAVPTLTTRSHLLDVTRGVV
jgi:hypothetical protein